MPKLKLISGTLRQDNIPQGVDKNIFAHAFDVNPLISLFKDLELKDFADDAAAATGGVKLYDFYHTSGTVKIRIA